MVKSKATEDETVHPPAAQVGDLKFPESGKMNIVKKTIYNLLVARRGPRPGEEEDVRSRCGVEAGGQTHLAELVVLHLQTLKIFMH